MSDIEKLRWVRIFTPLHIPRYLVEQIKDKDFSIDDFYRYHEINCLIQGQKQVQLNPFSHLHVLVDEQNTTKGFVWFTVEPLTKNLIIQNYSIDKIYWNKGLAVKKLSDFILEYQNNGAIKKIFWITNYPRHSEKYGFQKSKNVLMCYEGNYGNDKHAGGVRESSHGGNAESGEYRATGTEPKTTLAKPDITSGDGRDSTSTPKLISA
jgi:hypothetical protein